MDLVSIAARIPTRRIAKGEDTIDRLNYLFTPVILGVFGVMITMGHWVGNPITCWMPTHFTGSHSKFATSFCWVKNTYYLHFDNEIPKEHEGDLMRRGEIVYYQWLPFILLAQAVLFYMPNIVWTGLNQKGGMDADSIMASSGTLESTTKAENREKRLKLIANQIDRFVAGMRGRRGGRLQMPAHCCSTVCCCLGKRLGNYLTLLYIWIKLLYIGNIVFQLFALSPIFRTAFYKFGVESVEDHVNDIGFTNSSVFPKVTMCDFHVRRLGNVQRYTIQCVLPINLFAEKMYIFLWYWMVIVLGLTCLNLIAWLLKIASSGDRNQYIKNHLDTMRRLESPRRRELLTKFTFSYLKHDGVFLIRLIGHNTSHITAAEVTAALWDAWWDAMGAEDDPSRRPSISSVEKPPLEEQPPSP